MSTANKHDSGAPAARVVPVDLGDRSYEVCIGRGVFAFAPGIARKKLGDKCRGAFVVVDSGLPETAAQRAVAALRAAGLNATSIALIPTEHDKSLQSLGHIVTEMTRRKLERSDVVIALGGGIVGDLAGFAASVYRRGIAVIQCPTTLLSMVDASVGGKTGVNIDLAGDGADLKKNMVGAFHQPIGVLADLDTLATLDDRQFAAGLAECIKHAMISADFGDANLLGWTEANISGLSKSNAPLLAELIQRNVAVKARVVSGDEREEKEGGRALLNLGHTFAHAIEALPGARAVLNNGTELPGDVHHGEAVALGLRAAARTAVSLGLVDTAYADRVGALVDAAQLPNKVRGLPTAEKLIERMSHDKKHIGGNIRLVLPCGHGTARIVENPDVNAVRGTIEAIRA
ncbi:MAG: 3-dehydroquinate synthase [Planctomycetes bacterium]|nr:3-dehydroquinate synthase [Planctomycetota bacterium]